MIMPRELGYEISQNPIQRAYSKSITHPTCPYMIDIIRLQLSSPNKVVCRQMSYTRESPVNLEMNKKGSQES